MKSRRLFLYNWLLAPLPFGRAMRTKISYLRWCGIKIGQNLMLQPRVFIKGTGTLSIGDGVSLREGVMIECNAGEVWIEDRVEVNYGSLFAANCGAKLVIESDSHIAHFVSLKCSTHNVSMTGPSIAGESVFKDIVVGRGSWLCTGCVILPGVRLGARNLVAAGAVVLKDTPDNVLLCGVPAVVRKAYKNEEQK